MASNSCNTSNCYSYKSVCIIQNTVRKWLSKIKNTTCLCNKRCLNFEDVSVFNCVENKHKNDYNNKKREIIIEHVINKHIPTTWYMYSLRWLHIVKNVKDCIERVCILNDIKYRDDIKCFIKAGRNHHYDFILKTGHKIICMIEFKFNVRCIKHTPQFVSPMKPSKFFETSYEEFYYDNYLHIILKKYNLKIPEKREYLKYIHSTNPECLIEQQKKYYSGCKTSSKYTGRKEDTLFYKDMKNISSSSIKQFIIQNDINHEKLSEYIKKSQQNKL